MFSTDKKNFKYVHPDRINNMKSGSRTAPPAQPGLNGRGPSARVRVQAGDKGVSPIKSKPKKRKNLTAQEQTGLSMASVEWSEKTYPVADLVQYHGGRFPILVKVTHGYRGDLDVEYTSGMVVQLQGHGVQERLIATDSSGRRLSIPLEYPVDVSVNSASTREVRSLESAVRKYDLPLAVNVVSAREGLRIGQANILGTTLNIIDTHEDTYVKGNTITDGWIDQSDIVIIPSFLRVQFAVAVGMRDATEDEWDDYRKMFARSVRQLFMEFGRISGWPGVIIQDARTGGLGGLGSRPTSPNLGRENTYQNSPPISRALPREDLYQNLPPKSPGAKRRSNTAPKSLRVGRDLSPPIRVSSSSNETESSVHMIEADVHTNSLPSEPEIELVTLEPPPANNKNKEQQQNNNRRPAYENVELPPQPPHHRAARKDTYHNHTDGESADELDVDQMFERVLVVAEEEERRTLEREREAREREQQRVRQKQREHEQQEHQEHSRDKEQQRVSGSITTNSNTVMNLVNRLNSNASTRADVNQNRQHTTTNNAPRAVVPPTRQISNNNNNPTTTTDLGPFVVSVNVGTLKPENNNIEVSKTGVTNIPRYNSLEEVPRELDTLTVEEVCQCLELLNMSGHVEKFRHKQVDGKLMGDMKESVLQTEFNFTPFNASKLMRFARGWRPRFT